MEEKELLEVLIGMDRDMGRDLCKENGYSVRVTREDETNYAITMDFRLDRINLELDKGIITKCGVG